VPDIYQGDELEDLSLVDPDNRRPVDFELRREGDVLGLVQSGLPRLRVASLQREEHRDLAVAARRAAELLLDPEGRLEPGNEALRREMATGWLARIAAADPAGAA